MNKKFSPPGLNGKYEFDVKQILSSAFQQSSVNNWTLAQALLCILLITFAVYFIFLKAYGITDFATLVTEDSPLSVTQQAIMELVLTFLLAPLWTGVSMLAIRYKRGEKPSFTAIFYYYRHIVILALAALFVSMLTTLGISVYVIPGFYLFTATTFTLPLMADKKLNPVEAVLASIKMTNKYLWKMLTVYGIFVGLLLIVLLSFGFAYLWIGPFYFNVKAILYQDLFCEDETKTENQPDDFNNGVFNA